jgi:hypothetical protein
MAVSMDAFPDGAYFFGNALAGLVLHCRDYLKTRETQSFEAKPADELYRSSSNTFSCLTRPDPIAKIGKVMLPVDLIYSTAAKKGTAFRIKYDEVIFNAFRPHLVSGVKP